MHDRATVYACLGNNDILILDSEGTNLISADKSNYRTVLNELLDSVKTGQVFRKSIDGSRLESPKKRFGAVSFPLLNPLIKSISSVPFQEIDLYLVFTRQTSEGGHSTDTDVAYDVIKELLPVLHRNVKIHPLEFRANPANYDETYAHLPALITTIPPTQPLYAAMSGGTPALISALQHVLYKLRPDTRFRYIPRRNTKIVSDGSPEVHSVSCFTDAEIQVAIGSICEDLTNGSVNAAQLHLSSSIFAQNTIAQNFIRLAFTYFNFDYLTLHTVLARLKEQKSKYAVAIAQSLHSIGKLHEVIDQREKGKLLVGYEDELLLAAVWHMLEVLVSAADRELIVQSVASLFSVFDILNYHLIGTLTGVKMVYEHRKGFVAFHEHIINTDFLDHGNKNDRKKKRRIQDKLKDEPNSIIELSQPTQHLVLKYISETMDPDHKLSSWLARYNGLYKAAKLQELATLRNASPFAHNIMGFGKAEVQGILGETTMYEFFGGLRKLLVEYIPEKYRSDWAYAVKQFRCYLETEAGNLKL